MRLLIDETLLEIVKKMFKKSKCSNFNTKTKIVKTISYQMAVLNKLTSPVKENYLDPPLKRKILSHKEKQRQNTQVWKNVQEVIVEVN